MPAGFSGKVKLGGIAAGGEFKKEEVEGGISIGSNCSSKGRAAFNFSNIPIISLIVSLVLSKFV